MKEYLPYIVTVVCAIISGIASYIVTRKKAKTDMQIYKKKSEDEIKNMAVKLENEINSHSKKQLNDIKRTAIMNALEFIDTYLSWLEMDSGVTPIRDKEITSLELTHQARKCYNNLCMTCASAEILNSFANIVFGNGKNAFILYNEFRNHARNELGEKSLNLNNDRVFFSVVSTKSLDLNDIKKQYTEITNQVII